MEEDRIGADGRPAPAGARVLVSGAGFAGLATAHWMHGLGYRVTVVEIAQGLRKGGTPVDIKEGTVEVVRRMGLLDAVRARSLPPRRVEFKSADGTTEAFLPARPTTLDGPHEQHEIDRDELMDILFAAVSDHVDVVFGRSIAGLDEGPDGITARFADGSTEDFALVLGCDGTRSGTRRMTFGGDDGHMRFLKRYAYLKVVPRPLLEPNVTQIHSVPGLTAMLNGYEGKTDVALGFHAEREIAYDHRDKAWQRRLVRERFEGLGWRARELLEEIDADGDFYFDAIHQIRMPSWSRGRVALVGDAGYCPSPFAGMGGSMALVGAAALGDAFRRRGGDHEAAFRDYEAGLRPVVDRIQEEAVSFGVAMFAPETEAAIAERNRMLSEMGASTDHCGPS